MTLQNVHHIEADIKRKTYLTEPHVTANDDIAFIVSITDDGAAIDMASVTTAYLASTRLDKETVITVGAKLQDGTIKFELGHTETQVVGEVKAVAQLFDAEGDRISSVAWTYVVNRDPTGEGYIPTEKDKTFIEVVLVEGPAVIQEAKDVTAAAQQSVVNADAATERANTAAGAAETAAGNADSKAGIAQAAADAADQSKTDADNAATTANTAAGNANSAADDANQAGLFANTEGQKASEAATDVQQAKAETIAATQEALDAAELARDYVDNEGAIYGVFWPKVADPVLARTNSSQGKVANVGVDGQYVQNDFDDAQIYREIGEVTDDYGNEFIRIPKFYIRKSDGPGFKSIQISKTQHGGFYLPKCFWDFENGTELEFVLVGKYRASLAADNKLESKPDKFPLVSRNIVQFRDYARLNNVNGLKGYQQEDVHVRDVISTLFYVEFATLNSQAVMSGFSTGQYSDAHVAVLTEAQANQVVLANANADQYRVGQSIGIGTSRGANNIADYRYITAIEVVDANNKALVFEGTPLDITAGHFVYNTAYRTGFSRNVAASSGSPVSNTDGKWGCSYRGIESPWGDIYTFIDGINISDHQAWVAENADDYASNVFAHPYEKLGYINSVDSGYPKQMGYDANHPYAEMPFEVGGGSTTYYSDYYYQATGERVAIVGGYGSYGSSAGLSYWYAYYSSGSTALIIGGRLLKKAL